MDRSGASHIDVIDRWENMVAATPSGGWFQSSPVLPGLGFSISTRGQMFWLQEGLPSTLAPGRRPRTTLTPSMALRDGKPYLAWARQEAISRISGLSFSCCGTSITG